MSGTQATLLLDRTLWDLLLDGNGNIAMALPPYAVAQDAASAIRTFQGEVYYDTTIGLPYFKQVLGLTPPMSALKAQFAAAAQTVPGVVSAACYISSISGRRVSGQVQVTDSDGNTTAASF